MNRPGVVYIELQAASSYKVIELQPEGCETMGFKVLRFTALKFRLLELRSLRCNAFDYIVAGFEKKSSRRRCFTQYAVIQSERFIVDDLT
jgi:hypothetical protein